MYSIVPDSDVVLMRWTFFQSGQLLPLLFLPLVRLVINHLKRCQRFQSENRPTSCLPLKVKVKVKERIDSS